MPTVGVNLYNPGIMATACRREGCMAGGIGQRCKNANGQDVAPHSIRKRDAKAREEQERADSTVECLGG